MLSPPLTAFYLVCSTAILAPACFLDLCHQAFPCRGAADHAFSCTIQQHRAGMSAAPAKLLLSWTISLFFGQVNSSASTADSNLHMEPFACCHEGTGNVVQSERATFLKSFTA